LQKSPADEFGVKQIIIDSYVYCYQERKYLHHQKGVYRINAGKYWIKNYHRQYLFDLDSYLRAVIFCFRYSIIISIFTFVSLPITIIIILTRVGSLIAIILGIWYTIAPRSVQTAQAATLTDNPILFALPTPAYADISD
jgi:hypothetical protein